MDFTFNEEQNSIAALVKDFFRKEIDAKKVGALLETPLKIDTPKEKLLELMPFDILSKAHDVGLRQLTVPKEYGGSGIKNWVTIGRAAEEAWYWNAPLGYVFTMLWKQFFTMSYAPKVVQDEFFPAFMKNRKTWVAIAFTEPDHGSDVIWPDYDEKGVVGKVTAKQDGDYWIINGDKQFSTAGAQADWLIVAARTAKNVPYSKGMTAFIIPPNTPGVSLSRVHVTMAKSLLVTVALSFDNVRIHKRYMVSRLNEGSEFFKKGVMVPKTLHWPGMMGGTKKIYEEIVEYAKTRVQGGKPLIQHPNIGMLVAEADVSLEAAWLYMYRHIWDIDQLNVTRHEQLPVLKSCLANYLFKTVALRLVSIGTEVYGGIGAIEGISFMPWMRNVVGYLHGGGTPVASLIRASREM